MVVFFVVCIKVVVFLVEVIDEKVEFVCFFGENIGICFQIKDDIFDYFESKEIGKLIGNDMLEGKFILFVLYVLNIMIDVWVQEMVFRVKVGMVIVDEIICLIEFIK